MKGEQGQVCLYEWVGGLFAGLGKHQLRFRWRGILLDACLSFSIPWVAVSFNFKQKKKKSSGWGNESYGGFLLF